LLQPRAASAARKPPVLVLIHETWLKTSFSVYREIPSNPHSAKEPGFASSNDFVFEFTLWG
jgi:hypothetical protein